MSAAFDLFSSCEETFFEDKNRTEYGYVSNDPLNGIDPSGLRTDLICRPVGGSGGAVGGMHCYLRITPEAGSSLGSNPITLSLLTPDGKTGYNYINAPEDSGAGAYINPVDNGQCNTSSRQDEIDRAIFDSFNRQPNGTNYNPFTTNSNDFIHRVLEGSGLNVLPVAPIGAIGY